MDVEQPEDNGYSKVTIVDNDDENEDQDEVRNEFGGAANVADENHSEEEQEPLRLSNEDRYNNMSSSNNNIQINHNDYDPWYLKTMVPDRGISIRGYPLVEGSATVKLLKFILMTFAFIAIIHVIVAKFVHDRDRNLKLSYIWVFESNLIVLDATVFFVVGRLWKQRGVDHFMWIVPMIVCNIYFESQQYIFWLQNSVTLFAMHCIWPWQLWLFVAILIPTIGILVWLHVKRAYDKKLRLVELIEMSFCIFFFLAPLVPSSYFHFHHWYAGWLLGMHCNFDVWWSRAAMAYCWGMYINGIAVYGRDPVLTCEYAYFLSVDNHCPYTKCYLEALQEMKDHPQNATHVVEEMTPVDWKNCSATGYHP